MKLTHEAPSNNLPEDPEWTGLINSSEIKVCYILILVGNTWNQLMNWPTKEYLGSQSAYMVLVYSQPFTIMHILYVLARIYGVRVGFPWTRVC